MSGMGNVCFYNAYGLGKRGHDVSVITSNYPHISYKYPDVMKVIRYKPLFRIGNAPFLPQILKIKNFDIMHIHLPFYFSDYIIYSLKKFHNPRYIVTYHNDSIMHNLISKLYIRFDNITVMKSLINNSEKICVTSIDYARNSNIRNILFNKISNITELPCGVDINIFNPQLDGNLVRIKYKIEDKLIVLFVGGLDEAHYFKGLEYLLKSIKILKEKRVNCCLLVVGEGNLKNKYIKLCRYLGIYKDVIFVGNVSESEKPYYYACADLFVFPSITREEAFGIVQLEAMASGKPVIASNLPGVRTIIDNNKTGYFVQPKNFIELAEKMNLLLSDQQLRLNLGKEGRKKVVNLYSWDKIVTKLELIYEEVIRK
jgi:glycosyltransferase involved in cell wall biosynthesis